LSRLETPTGIKGGPFVPVGGSNRDKRLRGPFVPVGVSNRDKRPLSPAGPASRWTRDKSHLLSRAQRLPGQMAWNKGLFCSSEFSLSWSLKKMQHFVLNQLTGQTLRPDLLADCHYCSVKQCTRGEATAGERLTGPSWKTQAKCICQQKIRTKVQNMPRASPNLT